MAPTATSPVLRPTPITKGTKFSNFNVDEQVFYRTSSCVGIVNLKPIVPGHVLVIPIEPYHRLSEVPTETVGELFKSVQSISRVLEKVYGADALTISVQDGEAAGQSVGHLHVHILPRKKGDIEPNELVYQHLESWGFDPTSPCQSGLDVSEERQPRTCLQMAKEATYLSTHFQGRQGKLPVTLLSGFLGAGKTTLLENILTSQHGLRVAVVVNDMGALNIDASLLANHVTQSQERVVQMQNGCICCTLRGDLLEEVAKLAEDEKIDYLLIESTGISEPMQVAETFSQEFADMHVQAGLDLKAEMKLDSEMEKENNKVAAILAAGGLPAVATLDTCVTVVDALNIFNDYNTADFLADRYEDVPEEDDRNISDLLTDQLEFANIVLINKCDLVPVEQVEQIRSLVKTLNPDARVITTTRSKVDVKEILNTGMFSYDKAALGAGWLKSLTEEIKPETEEYGIGSFVYRARRPFSPKRLWETVRHVFVVIQEEYIDDGEEDDDEETNSDDKAMSEDERQPQLNPQARLASKKASPIFSTLLRSKGFFWLATRPTMFGEWSQAGVMLTLQGGSTWRCLLPLPQDHKTAKEIQADFEGEWGDRRQEIVFIGQGLDEKALTDRLDKCLLDDDEWNVWERIMKGDGDRKRELEKTFEDGFEDWLDYDEGHHHHDE